MICPNCNGTGSVSETTTKTPTTTTVPASTPTPPPKPRPMGIGLLGDHNVIIRRKFRWTLQVWKDDEEILTESFVKIDARPSIDIEETEINFLSAKTWIPGAYQWRQIRATFFDPEIPKFTKICESKENNDVLRAELKLYDGCGGLLESWKLREVEVADVQIDSLSPCMPEDLELTLKYKEVEYVAATPTYPAACTYPFPASKNPGGVYPSPNVNLPESASGGSSEAQNS